MGQERGVWYSLYPSQGTSTFLRCSQERNMKKQPRPGDHHTPERPTDSYSFIVLSSQGLSCFSGDKETSQLPHKPQLNTGLPVVLARTEPENTVAG